MKSEKEKEVHHHHYFWPSGDFGCALGVAAIILALGFVIWLTGMKIPYLH